MSELILAVGDDKVEMQNLDQCATSLDYNIKKGTKITFGTEMAITFNGTEKLGLVIWLPRDAVKAALDAEKASK
jgi:hypothetical protein